MAKKRSTPRRPPQTSQSSGAAKKKAWTVMVYMAAAKDDQTEKAAIIDVEEMQKADTSNVNVVVQVDRQWPPSAQRYRVANGVSQQIFPTTAEQRAKLEGAGREMNTGSAEPLIAFLDWVKDDADSRADHYLLVLWGHTYGLGFGRDHQDPLTLPELKRALATFKDRGLDILGANTCAMSYAEAAFELRSSASYLVASQMSMPFAGWPYKEVLNVIAADPKITPAKLGTAIAVEFLKSFERDVSMTVLDLGKADLLAAPVKKLAAELKRVIANTAVREQVVGAFLDTAHGDVRPLIDVIDLCHNLEAIGAAGVKAAAAELRYVLNDSGFLVKHLAGEELEGLNGVGIFAPGVTGAADLERLELSKKSYRALELVKQKDNVWSRLAFTELFKVLEDRQKSVADFVRSAGATTREDRTGLTQLVMSLDRAFVKLELALADTKKAIDSALEPKPGGRVVELPPAPARFGPPFLRLIGSVPTATSPGFEATSPVLSDKSAASGIMSNESVASSLEALERTLGSAERTVKRVLTNPRLGLGDDPDVKPGVLGADDPDVKPGVLGVDDPDVKPGVLGADDPDVKPGVLGLAPWLAAPGTTRSVPMGPSLVTMYREVARSLRMVEESVGKLETVLRTAMFTDRTDRTDADFIKQVKIEIGQALREVKEVIDNAKHTTRGVVVDPAEGLGPGVHSGRRGIGRQQLALAGGLSSKYLRLL